MPLLEQIAAAASSPAERRAGGWLEPVGGDERRVEQRLARWAEAAAGDIGAFDRLLAARGLTPSDARAGLRTVRVVPGAPRPAWVDALDELLDAAATHPATASALYQQVAARSLVPTARSSAPLVPGLAAALVDQLVWLGGGVLPDGRAWGDALLEHAALARALGVALSNGRRAARELCARFERDAPALAALLGTDRLDPSGCQPAAGDRHAGGRSVAIVELSGSPALVYKPRDLRLARSIAELALGVGLDLRLPRSLVCDGYGWEEFVVAAPPADDGERAALAYELGGCTRLFDLLGGVDLFVGNVLIAGRHAIPVDLETAIGFDLVDPASLPWTPPGSQTGLLTAPIVEHRQASFDLGLLAGPDGALIDHVDRIVDGFADVHRALARHATAVGSEIGEVGVRAVLRVTRLYDRLRERSLRRDVLADGVERELVLERLFRASVVSGVRPDVVQAEVDDLRDLDIPRFTFHPDATDLRAADGRILPDVLALPPLARITQRLAALAPEAGPAELDAVRTLAFCAAPGRTATVVAASIDGVAVDWAAEASAAAQELAAYLHHGGPGDAPLEAGLVYLPDADVFALMPERGPDPGLASVLNRAGEAGWIDAAVALRHATADGVDPVSIARESIEAPLGLVGIGGSLALVRTIEDELARTGDPEALGRARAAGCELLARRQAGGRWFPETHAADRYRLSSSWGLAAVVNALVALSSPPG